MTRCPEPWDQGTDCSVNAGGIFQLALIDYKHPPAQLNEFLFFSGISLFVSENLRFPKNAIGTGQTALAASMAVPKASVNKNYGSPLGEYYVRRAGKALCMMPESKSGLMQARSHNPLNVGTLTPDALHSLAALCFGQRVH